MDSLKPIRNPGSSSLQISLPHLVQKTTGGVKCSARLVSVRPFSVFLIARYNPPAASLPSATYAEFFHGPDNRLTMHLTDVGGGGNGNPATAIARAFPHVRGSVLDLSPAS